MCAQVCIHAHVYAECIVFMRIYVCVLNMCVHACLRVCARACVCVRVYKEQERKGWKRESKYVNMNLVKII